MNSTAPADEDLEPQEDVKITFDWGGRAGAPIPLGTLINAYRVLTLDTRWAGRIAFDEFAGFVRLDGQRLRDVDAGRIGMWMDKVYALRMPTTRVHEAVYQVADRYRFHPVRTYLEGLRWDGVERASDWLVKYLGVQDTELHRTLGRMFLVSAVARILEPGCQVDTVLVLTGKQGKGKSSALRALAQPWFSDTDLDLHSKDAYAQIQGVWIQEVAELQSFRGHEATRIKSFITSRSDRYRPAYGREVVDVPRQVAFTGSTNEDDFLVDATGARRFWPVATGQLDVPALRRDRDQLWAEAVLAYKTGERWHLDTEQADQLAKVHRAFEDTDVWQGPVLRWAESRFPDTLFSVGDVAVEALGMNIKDVEKRDEMRIAKILRRSGFHKVRKGIHQEVFWLKD